MSKKNVVYIYTDGACSGNPGPGGWAALLRWNGHEKTLTGGEKETTNNRMEMSAVIHAIEAIKKPSRIELYSDSKYVLDGLTQWLPGWKARGWKTASKDPVKNQDLWERLDSLIQPHEINFHWIRGHDGHVENEIVDKLAVAAIPKA